VQNVFASPAARPGADSGTQASSRDGAPASGAQAPRLVPAKYFVNPANNGRDIEVIRRNTDPVADIAGGYSRAVVSCGTGCTAFWIIDRRTGAIIDAPESSNAADTVLDIQGRTDSNVVRILYDSPDGSGAICRARDFRLSETTLVPLGELSPVACPH
jgi:hypothetical protein